MAESAFTLEHDHSVLGHTTDTEADYGTALCWAENAVGAQKAPCAFRDDGRTTGPPARQAVANKLSLWTYRDWLIHGARVLLMIYTLILPVLESFTNN